MADTPTPNFGFHKPAKGDRDWDVALNANADLSDTTLKAHQDRLDAIEAEQAANAIPDWVDGNTYPLAGTLVTHDFTIWKATQNNAVNYFTTPRVEPAEGPYVTALMGHGLIEFTWKDLVWPGTIAGGGSPDSILISVLVDGQGSPVEFMVEKDGNLDGAMARIPTSPNLPADNWATATIAMYDSAGEVASAVAGEFMTIRLWLVNPAPESKALRYWNVDWVKQDEADQIDARVFDRTLSRLSDALVENPQAGDVLLRKGGVWQNVSLAQAITDAGVSTASSLAELTDLTLTAVQDGDVIKRVGGQWVNAPDEVGTGGGPGGGGSEPVQATLVPVRQTVLTSRTDVNGQANFLEAGTGLAVNLYASAVDPVEIAFAAGFNEGAIDYVKRLTAGTVGAWSGLAASATNYLYADLDPATSIVTYGVAVDAPIYQTASPSLTRSDLVQAMTGSTGTSGTASASSELSGYPAWAAFDKVNNVSGWASNGTTQGWIQFLFGTAQIAGAYTIRTRSGDGNSPAQAPKAWTLKGSNNGTDWTDLDTQANQTGWAQGEARTFEFPNTATYAYYRLDVSEVNGSNLISVGEFHLLSNPGPGQHWFDISSMTMKVWNGSAWEVKNRVFLGEAATDGTGVTSVITYALCGRYEARFPISKNTVIAKSHNLGVTPGSLTKLGASTLGGPLHEFISIDGNGAYLYGAWIGGIGRTSLKLNCGQGEVFVTSDPNNGQIAIEAYVLADRGWGVGGGGTVAGSAGSGTATVELFRDPVYWMGM